MEVVARELLEALAEEAPQQETAGNGAPHSAAPNGNGNHKLMVEVWLADVTVPFRSRHRDSQGRDVWEVKCPFDEAHGFDACVTQATEGKLGFLCHHSGCAGNHWQEFKNKVGRPHARHFDPPLPEYSVRTGRIVHGSQSTNGNGEQAPPRPRADNRPASQPVFEQPVPSSQLTWQGSGKAVWEGFLNEGEVTLLTSLWKAGKTTLIAHLLKVTERGGKFCGLDVLAARVLYISEEHANLWIRRRDELGLADHIEFLLRPFRLKPTWEQWTAFLEHVRRLCVERSFQVVIVDTLAALWPVKRENDASEVQAALMPLQDAIGTAACLLNHHNRKSGGDEATAARGSGALCAFADTIVEMARFDPIDKQCCKRVLTGYGRHPETPKELVVELQIGGYVALGDKQETSRQDLDQTIKDRLPQQPPGLTVKELEADWREGKDECPRHDTLLDVLHHGAEASPPLWVRTGEGRKGDPYRFHRLPPGASPAVPPHQDAGIIDPFRKPDPVEWLRQALSSGPKKVSGVRTQAEMAGIGMAALEAAKRALGVQAGYTTRCRSLWTRQTLMGWSLVGLCIGTVICRISGKEGFRPEQQPDGCDNADPLRTSAPLTFSLPSSLRFVTTSPWELCQDAMIGLKGFASAKSQVPRGGRGCGSRQDDGKTIRPIRRKGQRHRPRESFLRALAVRLQGDRDRGWRGHCLHLRAAC
jgi:hypothetical protein